MYRQYHHPTRTWNGTHMTTLQRLKNDDVDIHHQRHRGKFFSTRSVAPLSRRFLRHTNMSTSGLRKCQKDCLKVMYGIKKPGIYNFQLATGAGKTRIMLEFIRKHPKHTFLILVPKLLLLRQFASIMLSNGFNFQLRGTGFNKQTTPGPPSLLTLCVYNSA